VFIILDRSAPVRNPPAAGDAHGKIDDRFCNRAGVVARGSEGGGGGSSKPAQNSPSTMKATTATGAASGKRMHKPFTGTTQSGRASLLRGNNGDNGGRYLAKKTSGHKEVVSVTLKRGITPEKVEAGSENVRRVK
jgi:hypothetical protein